MDHLVVARSTRLVHPVVTDEVLQSERHAAGEERRSSHKRLRVEIDDPAVDSNTEVPESPAVGDSTAAPAAAAAAVSEDCPAGGYSTNKLAALRPSSPAATPTVSNQPQPAPALTAAPSIQCDTPLEAIHPADAAAAAAAAMLAQKAGAARPVGSSRGTAAALQGKAAKARRQRVEARMEWKAAAKESDVDMFKESCVIC